VNSEILQTHTIVGSNATTGLTAGPLYLNGNNATTNVNANIGTGIHFKIQTTQLEFMSLAKTMARTNY
jgi:hypothetical protein